jgi:hypothetical protein
MDQYESLRTKPHNLEVDDTLFVAGSRYKVADIRPIPGPMPTYRLSLTHCAIKTMKLKMQVIGKTLFTIHRPK